MTLLQTRAPVPIQAAAILMGVGTLAGIGLEITSPAKAGAIAIGSWTTGSIYIGFALVAFLVSRLNRVAHVVALAVLEAMFLAFTLMLVATTTGLIQRRVLPSTILGWIDHACFTAAFGLLILPTSFRSIWRNTSKSSAHGRTHGVA